MTSLPGRALRLAVLVAAVSLVVGCAQSRKPSPASQAPQPTPQPAAAQPSAGDRTLVAGQPAKVALLLPLSGKSAAVGEALRNAAQMALFDSGNGSVTLIVKDTGETPDGAATAMQQAVAEGAQLVLGPLFGSQIPAVVPAAQTANVNVVAFSNDESRAGGNIFTMGVSPREAARRITAYAVSNGYSQIAVLAPNTQFGTGALQGAQEGVAEAGGVIVSSVFYDTSKLDLSDEVRQLGSGYSAVLTPDGSGRMIGLAPVLVASLPDGAEVKFLGSVLWKDPRIATDPNLVGSWFPASPPAGWETFKLRYQQAHGSEPPPVAALGYDAAALAAFLVQQAQAGRAAPTPTPGQWVGLDRSSLTVESGFTGVDGIFRFRPDGRVERGLAILEVQRDGFPVIQEPPAAFRPLVN